MVIVFDGVCNVCNGWVRFVLKRDQAGRFRFAHCQSDFGKATLLHLADNPSDPSTVVLVSDGQHYVRSDAILRVFFALGGFWTLVSLLRIVPRPLRDLAYTFFARHRYHWFGRTEQCAVPDPRWRDRFLA